MKLKNTLLQEVLVDILLKSANASVKDILVTSDPSAQYYESEKFYDLTDSILDIIRGVVEGVCKADNSFDYNQTILAIKEQL